LEATKVSQYPFLPEQLPQSMDWEMFIVDIARTILQNQTPSTYVHVHIQMSMPDVNGISSDLLIIDRSNCYVVLVVQRVFCAPKVVRVVGSMYSSGAHHATIDARAASTFGLIAQT
jgi:hypothetical protein